MLENFMLTRINGWLVLASFAVSAVALSCEKVPLLAPTGSSIVLTAGTTALAANGSIPIVAQVIESSGTPPHSGVPTLI